MEKFPKVFIVRSIEEQFGRRIHEDYGAEKTGYAISKYYENGNDIAN